MASIWPDARLEGTPGAAPAGAELEGWAMRRAAPAPRPIVRIGIRRLRPVPAVTSLPWIPMAFGRLPSVT